MKIGNWAPVAALVFGVTLTLGARGAAADDVSGLWLTEDGKAKIKIEHCDAHLCGNIVWLEKPLTKEGKPKVDKNNPDPTLRERPLIGLQILTGFSAAGEGVWEEGKIYSPSEGDFYNANIAKDGAGRLKLRGYVGIPLFGKTQVWTRTE